MLTVYLFKIRSFVFSRDFVMGSKIDLNNCNDKYKYDNLETLEKYVGNLKRTAVPSVYN